MRTKARDQAAGWGRWARVPPAPSGCASREAERIWLRTPSEQPVVLSRPALGRMCFKDTMQLLPHSGPPYLPPPLPSPWPLTRFWFLLGLLQ